MSLQSFHQHHPTSAVGVVASDAGEFVDFVAVATEPGDTPVRVWLDVDMHFDDTPKDTTDRDYAEARLTVDAAELLIRTLTHAVNAARAAGGV